MANTTKSDVFIPELLEEGITLGLRGKLALYNTGAAILRTDLADGKTQLGNIIRIPYFGRVGVVQDVADGDPLTPQKITSAIETATVQRSGIAFNATHWARYGAVKAGNKDIHQLAGEQMAEEVLRRADRALIASAVVPITDPVTGSTNVINTYTATGTPGPLTFDSVINARVYLGDEMEGLNTLIVHPKVWADLITQKDTQNRPLVVPSLNSGEFNTYAGMRVVPSELVPVDTTVNGSPARPAYTSFLVKQNAMIFWMDGAIRVQTHEDIYRDTQEMAINFYWAAYTYKHMMGGTRPGIVQIVSNGRA